MKYKNEIEWHVLKYIYKRFYHSSFYLYDIIITRTILYRSIWFITIYWCTLPTVGMEYRTYNNIYSVWCGLRKIAIVPAPEIREQNPIGARRTSNKSVLYNIIVIIVFMYELSRVSLAVNLRV